MVTDHEVRCATLLWVYTHSDTLANAPRARMLVEHGHHSITEGDSRAYLVAVLTVVDFLREQTDEAGLPLAQRHEFFGECADGWDLDWHDVLARVFVQTGRSKAHPHEDSPLLQALDEQRTSLRQQGDIEWVTDQLLDELAPAPEGSGAW